MALAPNVYLAVPAMVVAGAAWITVANALVVAAQFALLNCARAAWPSSRWPSWPPPARRWGRGRHEQRAREPGWLRP